MKSATNALLLAFALILAPNIGAAEGCQAQFPSGVETIILDNVLVTTVGGERISEHSLPIVGSAWRCIRMRAFPDHALLFIEWHEGAAGTSEIFSRISLLAFSIGSSGATEKGAWTLVQELQGKNGRVFEVKQTYKLEEMGRRVDVVLTGVRRLPVEPDWD